MNPKYLDQIEMKLMGDLFPRGKLRYRMTPTIKKAARVVDVERKTFPGRKIDLDAATAHEFRKTCVRHMLNIAQGFDWAFALWAARPNGTNPQQGGYAVALDPALAAIPDSFTAKIHPAAWGAVVDRARRDGCSLADAIKAAVLYWGTQPKREGESAALKLRQAGVVGSAVSAPQETRPAGRPPRASAVVPLLVHYEAPLAGRLRRYVARYGIKQRELLHLALESWLRAAPYGEGDPDAGGPIGREIEPIGGGNASRNHALQTQPEDLL